MKDKKWLLSFIYILLALILTMDIIALLFYFFAKPYLYLVRDVPFEGDFSELIRVIKGASLGGLVVGMGCWYASFKRER
ncbi:hypothetical protein [Erwinia rhapontici]|uniref:hypothetical protein n=1 Tax=Erwinia rhapontici TaxID=55212 RepID=UPI001331421D|nr:hypothetical protein [Erwinia rhapontici]MBP2153433.1 hypothetical protein [Erwinia rhapontici]